MDEYKIILEAPLTRETRVCVSVAGPWTADAHRQLGAHLALLGEAVEPVAPAAPPSSCGYVVDQAGTLCAATVTHTGIPWGESKPIGLCDAHRLEGVDGGVLRDVRSLLAAEAST